jgi:hypothetical protein
MTWKPSEKLSVSIQLKLLALFNSLGEFLYRLNPQFLYFIAVEEHIYRNESLQSNFCYVVGLRDQVVEELVVFEVLVAHVVLDLFLEGINISHLV